METQREYTNGAITIHWDASKCTHSANCVRGLPMVFNPKARPWINILAATSEELRDQVAKCPSGALTATMNNP